MPDVHPPQDVLASIGARHPDVLPDGQRDLPPGAVQLRGDLDTASRGADDEDPAVGNLVRVAVVRRGERFDPGGHTGLQRRHFGNGWRPRRHDRPGAPAVLVGLHHVPRSVCRTDVTVVFARTGAAFSFAYSAMSSATSETAR
jgi:hypothetical protein